jgi:hypothetical protein
MKNAVLFFSFLITGFQVVAQNFQWVQAASGTSEVLPVSVCVDNSGNSITVGNFKGTVDLDPGPAEKKYISAGFTDIFILKLDPSGNFISAQTIGDTLYDEASTAIIDKNGNLLITGSFQGTVDFDPSPAVIKITTKGYLDGFLLSIGPSGNFIDVKQFGGFNGVAIADKLTLDPNMNIYLTGRINGVIDIDPGPGIKNIGSSSGNYEIFIIKLAANGSLVWDGKIGGYGETLVNGILESNGYVYLTGSFTYSTDLDPGPASLYFSSAGSADIFLMRLDTSGNLSWAKSFGGKERDEGQSIVFDKFNKVYTTGIFGGTVNFDPQGNGILVTVLSQSLYLLKTDALGNYNGVKILTGGGSMLESAISYEPSKSLTIAGTFQSTIDFNPEVAVTNLSSVKNSIDSHYVTSEYLVRFNSNDVFQSAASFGSDRGVSGISLVNDMKGSIYTTGAFKGFGDFNPGAGSAIRSSLSDFINDMYLVRFNSYKLGIEAERNSGLRIEPNPAHDNISIKNYGKSTNTPYSILNATGQIVSQGILCNGESQLNLKDISPGIYILWMEGISRKIIIN